jgi:ATP-dependent helicase/nuclease subunit A
MTDDRRPEEDSTDDSRMPHGEGLPDGRSSVVGHPSSDRRSPVVGHASSGGPSPVVGRPSFRELKPEQHQAASTLDRHVAVTAGPGAGKTTVLVERYLNILRANDISVDQIVAITFTNRAANEMRERLRSEMDKLLQEAGPPARARWMRHKRTLDGAIITTIHGFCARLLREFPLEAGVDPQFALLDAHQSAMLEEATAEEALTEFISAGHQATTELAAGIGRAKLVRGLIDIYRSMRNQGLTIDQLARKSDQNHKTIEEYRQAVNELAGKMGDFIRTRNLSPAAEARRSAATLRWPALCQYLLSASDSTPVTDMREAIQEFREAARPNAQGAIGELVESLDELIWKPDLRGRVPQCLIDLDATKYAQELIKLVGRIERDLNEEKRGRGALDFDDLQARALAMLEEHPEVLRRTSARYRFFLVDEFQDTNALQRDLLIRLALGSADFSLSVGESQAAGSQVRHSPSPEGPGRLKSPLHANLFIVGDRKQSIYGFRGADVDVFREMTERIKSRNGLPVSLNRNFRSQHALITFFNVLFERVFAQDGSASAEELNELGYVAHESSIAARKDEDALPVVELLVDLRPNNKADDRWSGQTPRERDAEQLAARIVSMAGNDLVSTGEESEKRALEYRDIALLFRAMTEVHLYEAALRRAGVPYVTVEGRGFYAREEITDFIQLLRFLDNKTDEVALAAVLRSPICGLSDDTLLALRCAPARVEGRGTSHRRGGVRPLLDAVRDHELIEMIDDAERPALDRARLLLSEMMYRATRSRISALLRFAVEACEYRTVAAANFDGAGRLANIEKLFTLAERFERAGAHLIRDFVRYVRDFEEAGGRESEGQIDDGADAVRLMSIHQSKGLEFPVVIIPDLHRQPDNRRDWWALDRHRGLTLKVPDGRGKLAAGCAYTTFAERAKRRDQFESMRLLYVAATRAKDRLILSGAAKDLTSLRGSWLEWLTSALEVGSELQSRTLKPREAVEVRLTLNLLDSFAESSGGYQEASGTGPREEPLPSGGESFPLLASIEPQRSTGLHRFSVTQLLNHERCPRQYYFERVLHAPGEEEIAVWNDAEAPEPPANLTATLRGAVIHRFCEKFREGDEIHDCLKSSFEDVLRQRAAELGERVLEIDPEKAIHDLLALARNYVGSKVRERIEAARAVTQHSALSTQHSALSTQHFPPGVFSEQRFRLRRPLGILTGTIDKMLVSPTAGGFNVEIIDFKTNRFRGRRLDSAADGADSMDRGRRSARHKKQVADQAQMDLGFVDLERDSTDRDLLIQSEVEAAAIDYRVQMQAYALAVRELMPGLANVRATLHFLDPEIEVSLSDELLDRDLCAKAIDDTMVSLVSSSAPEGFPPRPADHCRICKFVELCLPGRRWLTGARP